MRSYNFSVLVGCGPVTRDERTQKMRSSTVLFRFEEHRIQQNTNKIMGLEYRTEWDMEVFVTRTSTESEHWIKIIYEIHVHIHFKWSENGPFSCSRHIRVKVDGFRWHNLDGHF